MKSKSVLLPTLSEIPNWSRREVLSALTAAGIVGCSGETFVDETGTSNETGLHDCGIDFDENNSNWHRFALDDYPALREPGGWVKLKDTERLLDILVAHVEEGCLVALWRICSHGACPLLWFPSKVQARCGCHGSQFNRNGEVLLGPATKPIRAFPAVIKEEAFWIYREG